MSNRNKRLSNDEARRRRVKEQLHKLSTDKRTLNEKATDLYNEATQRFINKGYDEETAKAKAIHTIGLFIPEGYSVGVNKSGTVNLMRVTDVKVTYGNGETE